ncbi:30S ribosomal protein S9 [Candidatus Shapirobacteria bacterium CG_4_9_14_0_2_um_filter_39_11]|uniref:Small ribosomal subunit protein uS9 n=1 Tax=Candidatus Shapirobacteria bacterium CG_4_9_14_0_2_um_filter_39_11 TaxID=1974478 RepID=A0A2M8ET76_9BACT|nr:MAG: 30S ribosomal protein S9 [Candidatus Shapirobacteria bacterium CG_4_9_14_0_2_um_filter_39_11]
MGKKSKVKSQKSKFVFAIGRRKTATAKVRLFSGKGEILVNGKPIGDYFSGEVAKIAYLKPFQATDTLGKYYATIKTEGSGKEGQLEAVIHGLARALDKENSKLYHSVLKKSKLLTRDPRAKERRKVGLAGKARKKKQSPKR